MKSALWAGKTARGVKVLRAKPHELSLIPGTHTGEGVTCLLQAPT